jgi:hypothetical protein
MRLTMLPVAALLIVAGATAPALGDVRCVQEELLRLGYDPGPADGLMGGRTRSAATDFAGSAGATLPELTGESATAWCQALKAEPTPPIDVSAPARDALSGAQLEALWGAYRTTNECMQHSAIGSPSPVTLRERTAEDFAAAEWASPFTQERGAEQCRIEAGGLVPPAPIPVVTLDERYGERVGEVDMAAEWFGRMATYVRLTDDPVARAVLKRGVLDWARAGSLTEGVRISRDDRPIDFQMMQAILTVLNATAEIAVDFEPAERGIVGLWLQNIVGQVADSTWRFRQDNKPFLRSHVALIWALMTDDELAVRQVVENFKQAITEMRPDGSWPIDSQRGGSGLLYGSRSTNALVLTALALQSARGVDLFSFEVDGRSIHTAVDFIVQAIREPSATNQIYALSCADGGDRFGSVSEPDLYGLEEASYLVAYAERFPEREASQHIREAFPATKMFDFDFAGGRASCQFALQGGEIDLAALVMPDLEAVWPVAEHVVRSHEEISGTSGRDRQLDVLWFSDVLGVREGDDPLRYNILGDYAAAVNRFMSLRFSTKTPVDDETADELLRCGAKTDFYDDAHHPVMNFAIDKAAFTARNAECVLDALPERQAEEMRFLVDHFQDIALGWASTGDLAQIQHEGLRDLILAVAKGEITFSR